MWYLCNTYGYLFFIDDKSEYFSKYMRVVLYIYRGGRSFFPHPPIVRLFIRSSQTIGIPYSTISVLLMKMPGYMALPVPIMAIYEAYPPVSLVLHYNITMISPILWRRPWRCRISWKYLGYPRKLAKIYVMISIVYKLISFNCIIYLTAFWMCDHIIKPRRRNTFERLHHGRSRNQ